MDKFYTVSTVAAKCINSVGSRYDWADWDLVVEPSAGNGSFLMQIPHQKRIGIDISPDHPVIIEGDFLEWAPPAHARNILVIGNPPFGRVSSLAVKFFNHAARWAGVIAFIVPRTFRRPSIHNKLDPNFHLELDEEIPTSPCAFDPPMMAKCCFQIWKRGPVARERIELPTIHADWDFLALGPKDDVGQPTPPRGADFALRAYGGRCGEIRTAGLDGLRPKSWHWIRSKIDKNLLISRFERLNYSVSLDTARQNSIGRGELVMLYSRLETP
jgi:hypothetical protein